MHILNFFEVTYGCKQDTADEIIKSGLLPEWFSNFRQQYLGTFDLECTERISEEDIGSKTTQLGVQNIVSMALASNLPNQKSTFFLRKSSDPRMAFEMVKDFVLHSFKLYELFMDYLPVEIKRAIKKLEYKLKSSKKKFWIGKTKEYQHLRFLRKFTTFPMYGFNSSKVHFFKYSNTFNMFSMT